MEVAWERNLWATPKASDKGQDDRCTESKTAVSSLKPNETSGSDSSSEWCKEPTRSLVYEIHLKPRILILLRSLSEHVD